MVLKNILVGCPAPRTYHALDVAFIRLSKKDFRAELPVKIGVGFVLLKESGQLPEYTNENHVQEGIATTIKFALNVDSPVPDFSDSTWRSLNDWLRTFIRENTELNLPKNW